MDWECCERRRFRYTRKGRRRAVDECLENSVYNNCFWLVEFYWMRDAICRQCHLQQHPKSAFWLKCRTCILLLPMFSLPFTYILWASTSTKCLVLQSWTWRATMKLVWRVPSLCDGVSKLVLLLKARITEIHYLLLVTPIIIIKVFFKCVGSLKSPTILPTPPWPTYKMSSINGNIVTQTNTESGHPCTIAAIFLSLI